MKVPSSYMGIKKVRIEMLPLIDIVFLLLVFFIYAMLSMAVHHSLPVALPTSSTAEISRELNLEITVRTNGEIFLDQVRVPRAELLSALLDRQQQSAPGKAVRVNLFADRKISYQELYSILDIIRSSGIENVSLQADTNR